MIKYYKIEPDLSDNRVAYIDDWEFTYWPNKPQGEIVKNPDGTFSVIMEEDFTPLVDQLKNLFKDGSCPEDGTYLGEAVLTGRRKPTDLIYGDFIGSKQALVVSDRLLQVLKRFNLPEYNLYELPLIRRKKKIDGYRYIYFNNLDDSADLDVRLIKGENSPLVCVSGKLKEDICNSGIDGCEFTLINELT